MQFRQKSMAHFSDLWVKADCLGTLSHKRNCFGDNNSWFPLIIVKNYSVATPFKNFFGTHQCKFVTIKPSFYGKLYKRRRMIILVSVLLCQLISWFTSIELVNTWKFLLPFCFYLFRPRSQSTNLRLNKINCHYCVWANSRRDETAFKCRGVKKTWRENNPVYNTFLDILTVCEPVKSLPVQMYDYIQFSSRVPRGSLSFIPSYISKGTVFNNAKIPLNASTLNLLKVMKSSLIPTIINLYWA